MNAGISGSDPAFELKLLEMRLFQYHPDAVVMSINKSDITDFMVRGGEERFRADSTVVYRKPPWWENIYGSSVIVRTFIHGVCRLNADFMNAAEADSAYRKSLNDIIITILKCNKECTDRQIRFIANFHPTCDEIKEGYMNLDPVKIFVQEKGVEIFDMRNYFRFYFCRSLLFTI
jgi:hypothetical protein